MVKVQHKGEIVGHTFISIDYRASEPDGPFPGIVDRISHALKTPDGSNMPKTPAVSHKIKTVWVDWQGAFVSTSPRFQFSFDFGDLWTPATVKRRGIYAECDMIDRARINRSPSSQRQIFALFSSTWLELSILTTLRSSLKKGKSYHHIPLLKRMGT